MLPDQQRARLELHWLASDSVIGRAALLPLDGRNFPTHAWAGSAPEGVSQAEIRLIQPRSKGNLVVRSVSLSRSDLASVPLTFLAEAPGELSVSDLRVAYEPAREPDKSLAMQREAAAARARLPAAEIRSLEARGLTRLACKPVGIIAGVGTETESSLTAAGITTVGDLAGLDLTRNVNGIDPERLLEVKAKAEVALAIRVPLDAFPMLAAESLETLLFSSPSNLAASGGRPLARIEALQRDLRALRLHVKNADFRDLILSDLIAGGG